MRKNSLILLQVFFVFIAFIISFVLAAFFISIPLSISSTAVLAQGNSITGYFIVNSDVENKEIIINNASDNSTGSQDTPAEAAGSSGQGQNRNQGIAPLTGYVTIEAGKGQDSHEPGLIERMFGRIVSFFSRLF